MKTLIQIFIVAMFGIEICSPFFLSYLNQKAKMKQTYSVQDAKYKIKADKEMIASNKEVKNWKSVDFTENNYSDSKTIRVKE